MKSPSSRVRFDTAGNARGSGLAAILSGSALLLFTPITASLAQQSQNDAKANWHFVCAKLPAVTHDECGLLQTAMIENRNAGMTLAVIRKPGVKGYTVRFVAPLGVLLSKGISIRLDETSLGMLGFIRCYANGCVAQTNLEVGLVERLMASKTIRMTVHETPNEAVSLSLELADLATSLRRSLPLE